MSNTNHNHIDRMASKASILLFAGTMVMPEKGKIVRAGALYVHYCTRAARAGKRVSRKKFYRILDKSGYMRRPDIRGDYYENLSFIKGATS